MLQIRLLLVFVCLYSFFLYTSNTMVKVIIPDNEWDTSKDYPYTL